MCQSHSNFIHYHQRVSKRGTTDEMYFFYYSSTFQKQQWQNYCLSISWAFVKSILKYLLRWHIPAPQLTNLKQRPDNVITDNPNTANAHPHVSRSLTHSLSPWLQHPFSGDNLASWQKNKIERIRYLGNDPFF